LLKKKNNEDNLVNHTELSKDNHLNLAELVIELKALFPSSTTENSENINKDFIQR